MQHKILSLGFVFITSIALTGCFTRQLPPELDGDSPTVKYKILKGPTFSPDDTYPLATAICEVARNISDQELTAIARTIARKVIQSYAIRSLTVFYYKEGDDIKHNFTVARVIWGTDLKKDPLPLGRYENHSFEVTRP